MANFAAYTFAPPILVTPLGALTVLIGYRCFQPVLRRMTADWGSHFRAILASLLLNEELGHLGRIGCTLALAGSLIIVLHAPEDKPVETVDEILNYALQPGSSRFGHHASLAPTNSDLLSRSFHVLLFLRYRLHIHHDIRHCTQIRSPHPNSLYLNMLSRRLRQRHVHKRLRNRSQAHSFWKQPIFPPKHIRLYDRDWCFYNGSDELL